MDFEAFRVDHFPVDQDLLDAGSVGPELAHLAGVYRHSPRALVWRNPSSDWRLFVLLLPLASRLSLMANPIFAQLTRAWGLNVRFVGVDRTGLCYDFRALLTDRTLKLLLEFLECDLDRSHDPAVLDTLFAALAGEMLTILQQRRSGWDRHLAVEHRLEPDAEGSLFARASRYPDFLAKLREALRTEIIDVAFYGRALRSIDLRETTFEQRVASLIEGALDEVTMAKLVRTGAGKHLGCYNWLRIDPRHAASRAHVLGRLPGLASFLAQTLLPLEARRLDADEPPDPREDDWMTPDSGTTTSDAPAPAPDPRRRSGDGFDLRTIAARTDSSHTVRWAGALRRAIDAGQDRLVIEALAQRFAVSDNTLRRLWRETPRALGQPPAWQLSPVLRQLDALGDRGWPTDDAQWRALLARAVPVEAR
ncbi:MAG TPA: hypothetical protein PK072_12185 [Quisquiliibacterium sp.]|nr:hypothetical protein [Quisquiliibacterium sp.]